MDKKSILIYESWATMLLGMEKEAAGEVIQAVCAYAFKGECREYDNPMLNGIFAMIKDKLDEDSQKYEETLKKRSEAGKKGNDMRWRNKEVSQNTTDNRKVSQSDNKQSQSVTNIADSDSVSDSVSPTEIKKEKRTRFTPPTVEEVSMYCLERNNGINPDSFIDFYTSKGWKIGNQPMKDWKAAVRTWEKRDREQGRASPQKFNPTQYLLGKIAEGGFD